MTLPRIAPTANRLLASCPTWNLQSAFSRQALRYSIRTTQQFGHRDIARSFHGLSTRSTSTIAGNGLPTARKARRRLRALAITAGVITFGAFADHYFFASAATRTFRCAFYAALILGDFKWSFHPGQSKEDLERLHTRVAKRMHYVCTKNGGLFIKLGQSIGIQAAVMPKPYVDAFSTIFDAAPPVSYAEVEKVFKQEFGGKSPLDIFEFFDKKPLASASIAQVHRARLRVNNQDGTSTLREVAVKVQRPAIAKQIALDMWSYQIMLNVFQWAFDIPVAFTGPYITKQIKRETDFEQEARNSEQTAEALAQEPSLRDSVYVPRIHWAATRHRVMTADFVEGAFKVNDRKQIEALGFSVKEVMDAFCGAFSAMIFAWGHVHCDPHPGNVLVRRHPANPSKFQLCILDHGLYIHLSPEFRRQYSELWRALFVVDLATIERIAKSWGIADANLFASATLLKPTTVKKSQMSKEDLEQRLAEQRAKSAHQVQQELKERLKSMLENEQLIPRELIFLARMQRMVQAVNQGLGSPSNRINILAHWSAEGLRTTYASRQHHDEMAKRQFNISDWLSETRKIWTLKLVLVFIDFGFVLSKVRQWYIRLVSGREEGFEDLLQASIAKMAKDEYGVEIDDRAFAG